MIDGAIGLGNHHRLRAHLHHQCLGDRQHGSIRRDTKRAIHETGQVQAHAREGHRRVKRQWNRTDRADRVENTDAEPA
ncbi:hypothetical protein D3C86_2098470 [compost metagenome]